MMRIVDRRHYEDKEVFINPEHITSIEGPDQYDGTYMIRTVDSDIFRVDKTTRDLIISSGKHKEDFD